MRRYQIHEGYAARLTPRLAQKSAAQPLAFLLHGSGLRCSRKDKWDGQAGCQPAIQPIGNRRYQAGAGGAM